MYSSIPISRTLGFRNSRSILNSNQTGRPFTNQTVKSYPRFFKPPDTLHLVFAFRQVVRKIGIPLETFLSFVISVNNVARIL